MKKYRTYLLLSEVILVTFAFLTIISYYYIDNLSAKFATENGYELSRYSNILNVLGVMIYFAIPSLIIGAVLSIILMGKSFDKPSGIQGFFLLYGSFGWLVILIISIIMGKSDDYNGRANYYSEKYVIPLKTNLTFSFNPDITLQHELKEKLKKPILVMKTERMRDNMDREKGTIRACNLDLDNEWYKFYFTKKQLEDSGRLPYIKPNGYMIISYDTVFSKYVQLDEGSVKGYRGIARIIYVNGNCEIIGFSGNIYGEEVPGRLKARKAGIECISGYVGPFPDHTIISDEILSSIKE